MNHFFPWTQPLALKTSDRTGTIESAAGLYRIRRAGNRFWDYMGQSGNVKKRMSQLQGLYKNTMPYRDPHTAAPGLWALLDHEPDCLFEVSFCYCSDEKEWRKGLEALAIAFHRQKFKASPTLNFGRMPVGYRMSSSNNKRLVKAGLRYRGGPSAILDQNHEPGVPPAGDLSGVPGDLDWCDHSWSGWSSMKPPLQTLSSTSTGLYRIREQGSNNLLYIGEGIIRSRLMAHMKKARNAASAQGNIFAAAKQLEASWVIDLGWEAHQRLELECDLIGAHLWQRGQLPAAQFRG